MPVRKIIRIDEELCDGCGDCVPACHEGAIQIIDGKAKLVSETYCDGLGDCLGECPQGAITMEEREAAEYDEEAVTRHLQSLKGDRKSTPVPVSAGAGHGGGCPGSALRQFNRSEPVNARVTEPSPQQSALGHWPVQLMLVPPQAPFLKSADLLICADCVPFAVPDFHSRYLEGRAVLVGCPKLDNLEFYREKLSAIFQAASPRKITVLKMEVPCCNGIADAAIDAAGQACETVPIEVHTIGIRGGVACQQV